MAKKRWRIVVTFPELTAARAQQEATIEAGTLAAACARALREIRARPGIKGRRYTTVTLQVTRLPYVDFAAVTRRLKGLSTSLEDRPHANTG